MAAVTDVMRAFTTTARAFHREADRITPAVDEEEAPAAQGLSFGSGRGEATVPVGAGERGSGACGRKAEEAADTMGPLPRMGLLPLDAAERGGPAERGPAECEGVGE
ncbi:hypothetical protein A4U61_24720 [Streptomyces sp. H-KF8]|uniref:hypothetical protein n=1 Tax=Streptomyces sp. H-KF8 TaxID=1727216 RepID=UPI0007EC90E3|nr:hypothetical protein [Streptomyces sp. H-KF8]OBQ48355.1 hypothetical protein A4U61_24720 [Streptomyces sp. H-KF8]